MNEMRNEKSPHAVSAAEHARLIERFLEFGPERIIAPEPQASRDEAFSALAALLSVAEQAERRESELRTALQAAERDAQLLADEITEAEGAGSSWAAIAEHISRDAADVLARHGGNERREHLREITRIGEEIQGAARHGGNA